MRVAVGHRPAYCSPKSGRTVRASAVKQPPEDISGMAVLTETLKLPQLNFHPGELAVQEISGVRELVVSSGLNAFIRPYMPNQHREFFNNQKLFYISGRNAAGQVWVSVLPGQPGFVSSPDDRHLLFSSVYLHPEDPVASCLKAGAHLGGLGLELPTRRRNRVNLTVVDINSPIDQDMRMAPSPAGMAGTNSMLTKVELSYGNCPKYIQARELELDYDQLPVSSRAVPPRVERGGAQLGPAQLQLVRNADTIFIGSCYDGPVPEGTNPDTIGCDCSHRGGPPGFVQVAVDAKGTQPTKLTWADYRGNKFYQTLGNIRLNPAAGLLIIDFTTGGTLQLTGHASANMNDTSLPGALHTISFEVTSFVHIHNALPLKQVGATNFSPFLPGPVPFSTPPGTSTATETAAAAKSGSTAETVEVVSVTQAARDIKTFEVRLPDQKWVVQPGQYATFEFMPETLKAPTPSTAPGAPDNSSSSSGAAESAMLRTWTISSHPQYSAENKTFQITVKKVGVVTAWMHENLKPGMKLNLRAVGGEFGPELYYTSPPAKALSAVSAAQAVAAATRSNSAVNPLASPVEGALLLAGGIGITPMWPILYELTHPCEARKLSRSTIKSTQPGTGKSSTPETQPAFIVLVYSVRTLQDAALLPQIASVLEKEHQWRQYEQSASEGVSDGDGSTTDPNTGHQTLKRCSTCGSMTHPYIRVVLSISGKGADADLEGLLDPTVLQFIHIHRGRLSQQMVAEHIQAASSIAAALDLPAASSLPAPPSRSPSVPTLIPTQPPSDSELETNLPSAPLSNAAEVMQSASNSGAPFDSIRAAYACGPPGFMESVESMLGAEALGFDVTKRLHTESFNF